MPIIFFNVMRKGKNIKATYRKPTVEVYPLLEECPILAGTNTEVNAGVSIQPYVIDSTHVDIGGGEGKCELVYTTDDGVGTWTTICH